MECPDRPKLGQLTVHTLTECLTPVTVTVSDSGGFLGKLPRGERKIKYKCLIRCEKSNLK